MMTKRQLGAAALVGAASGLFASQPAQAAETGFGNQLTIKEATPPAKEKKPKAEPKPKAEVKPKVQAPPGSEPAKAVKAKPEPCQGEE